MSEIITIGVVGAGQMGSGIAQVFATAGFNVILHDIEMLRCEKALQGINRSLAKLVEKGRLANDVREAALKRITTTMSINGFSGVDFAIEAATEKSNIKLAIFSDLDRVARPDAILATNTSSIPISTIGGATRRPSKVIGMHFMNPVPLIKGVEVIRSSKTSDETYMTTVGLVEKLGKRAVTVSDKPGFAVNRILVPMIREAIAAFSEGIATKEDIDRAMVDCCNFPMGPLALADFVGLDTLAFIMNVMADGLGDERYRPPKLLLDLIASGKLGKKTGKGFYDYA